MCYAFSSFTTPEAGPPDPPLGVQVEECSNKNYLLVTWLPVTLNTLGKLIYTLLMQFDNVYFPQGLQMELLLVATAYTSAR